LLAVVIAGAFVAVSVSSAAASDLYALSPNGTALSIRDGGRISSLLGVQVNSDSQQAAVLTDGSEVTGGLTEIVGTYRLTDGSSFAGGVATGAGSVNDPLQGLQAPPVGASSGSVSVTKGLASLDPGTYGSVSVTGGILILNPGVYVITGGVKVSGTGQLMGNGVLLYLAPGAGFALSGSSSVSLTPQSFGAYNGVSIFFDKNSTATFSSTGTVSPDQRHISGAVYLRSGALDAEQLDASEVVANTVIVPNGGTLNVGP
jgi:hypothetical protein